MASKRPEFTDPRPLVERMLHQPGEEKANKSRRTVTVNLAESPLAWLHARGLLNDRQLLAGEKLRGDYEAAAIGARVTMCWDNVPQGKQKRSAPEVQDQSNYMIAAKIRFDNALPALGRDLSDIAWRVICAGEAMPSAERSLGWPARSGKLVLRIALDRLADFYRLPE